MKKIRLYLLMSVMIIAMSSLLGCGMSDDSDVSTENRNTNISSTDKNENSTSKKNDATYGTKGDGGIVDDIGDDVIDGAEDIGDGIINGAEDIGEGVSNALDGNDDKNERDTSERNTTKR